MALSVNSFAELRYIVRRCGGSPIRGLYLVCALDVVSTLVCVSQHSFATSEFGFITGTGDLLVGCIARMVLLFLCISFGRRLLRQCYTLDSRPQSPTVTPPPEQMEIRSLRTKFRYDFIAERQRYEERQIAKTLKSRIIYTIFGLFTAMNIFIAVKAIYFEFRWEPLEPVAFCATIVWTNAEAFLLHKCLKAGDGKHDAFVPKMHPHPLQFNAKVLKRKCEACSFRVPGEGLECSTCDYICCLDCYRKNAKRDANVSAESPTSPTAGDLTTGSTPPGDGEQARATSTVSYIWSLLSLTMPFRRTLIGVIVVDVRSRCRNPDPQVPGRDHQLRGVQRW